MEPNSEETYYGTYSGGGMMYAAPIIVNTETKKVIDESSVCEEPVEAKYETLINTKALSKYASTYELERFEKNMLMIFNQENIDGYQKRFSTRKDVYMLMETFSQFGFDTLLYQDFTRNEIIEKLKSFTNSKNDLTDYGCVAVAILTSGSDNGLLRAKDQQYSEIEVINHLKVIHNPTLVTKPKILIIQACRDIELEPVAVFQTGQIKKDWKEAVEHYILPVESDMLMLHSSYGGNPSHRSELHGSWFIQELCKKINLLAETQDLESIMIEVKREVAINKYHYAYNRRTLKMATYKQMPVTISTLIRKLYLRKYGDAPPELK